jgi:hypothetical protein
MISYIGIDYRPDVVQVLYKVLNEDVENTHLIVGNRASSNDNDNDKR